MIKYFFLSTGLNNVSFLLPSPTTSGYKIQILNNTMLVKCLSYKVQIYSNPVSNFPSSTFFLKIRIELKPMPFPQSNFALINAEMRFVSNWSLMTTYFQSLIGSCDRYFCYRSHFLYLSKYLLWSIHQVNRHIIHSY